MNKNKVFYDEHGQALIQFALMFMVLLAFVALAVEGGSVYAVRRQMQNAADAGALAAARELCLDRGASNAINKANEYLGRNGLSNEDIALSTVSIQGHRVSVTARTSAFVGLARLVGWGNEAGTIDVGATARAACGAANSACGLWPIAIDGILFADVPCGESIIVWDADNDGDEATCVIDGQQRPLKDCYTCQGCSDPEDFTLITSISRGWMDFPEPPEGEDIYVDPCKANGCGANELACRLFNGYGGRITLPACIPGLRGIKAGVKDEVNSRAGDSVSVPLFTSINCASGSNCSGKEAATYRVTQLGCIRVTGWIQTFRLLPRPHMGKEVKAVTSKAIEASKDCSGSCVSFCGSTNGQAAAPGEVRSAGLVP
ncbi:MAG: pilus assembly protein TadG-related protein [Caldilinea sp.]